MVSVTPRLHYHMFEFKDLLSEKECDFLVKISHDIGYQQTEFSDSKAKIHNNSRNKNTNNYYNRELAQTILMRLKDHIPIEFRGSKLVSVNDAFRFFRYEKGHEFNWYRDGKFSNSRAEVNQFTLLVYLNDDFEGGHTTFTSRHTPYDFEEFWLKPKKGDGLAFYHDLTHRGDKVFSGTKYVLRSDLMYDLMPFD